MHRHGFEDFSYKHITSIKYEKHAIKSLIILGALFIIIGSIGLISPSVSIFTFAVIFILVIVLGIVFIVRAFVFKLNFYLIRTSGGEDFKIPGDKQESKTEAFIKVIREHTE